MNLMLFNETFYIETLLNSSVPSKSDCFHFIYKFVWNVREFFLPNMFGMFCFCTDKNSTESVNEAATRKIFNWCVHLSSVFLFIFIAIMCKSDSTVYIQYISHLWKCKSVLKCIHSYIHRGKGREIDILVSLDHYLIKCNSSDNKTNERLQ